MRIPAKQVSKNQMIICVIKFKGNDFQSKTSTHDFHTLEL